MSSDLLRRAADRLDELAGAATPGPWAKGEVTPAYDGAGGRLPAYADVEPLIAGGIDPGDAAYIAALGPNVGTALAAWLRQAAMDEWAHGRPDCCVDGCDECDDDLLAPHLRRALLVARQILGPDAA